jgi:tetratricopeptide (TPR) repeat protein
LEQIERIRGPFDPAVAQSLNDLGALYRSLGRYSRAIDLLERAVQILDRNPQEKIACSALNNLGNTYYDIGQYTKANTFARRALAIAESGNCEDRSDLGYVLNSLGGGYLQRKQYTEAEAALRKAVVTFADTLGSQHPDYALALTNLQSCTSVRGAFGKHCRFSNRQLVFWERRFGSDAPILASALHVDAEVLKALGRKSEARKIVRRTRSMARPAAATVDIRALTRRR